MRAKDLESVEESIPESRTPGQIVPVELDSTREDSLRACLDAVRAKLPAGEDGKLIFDTFKDVARASRVFEQPW